MSITESERYIEIIKSLDCENITSIVCEYNKTGCSDCSFMIAKNKAIQALKEVQQLHAIGTVEEFRELKEKATPKKPIYSDFDENEDEEIIPYKAVCPVCGYEFEFGTWNDEENHHCECGQRMLWE